MRVSSINDLTLTYIDLYDTEVASYLNSVVYRQHLLSIAKKSMEMAQTKGIQVRDARLNVIIEEFKAVPIRLFRQLA